MAVRRQKAGTLCIWVVRQRVDKLMDEREKHTLKVHSSSPTAGGRQEGRRGQKEGWMEERGGRIGNRAARIMQMMRAHHFYLFG